MYCFSTQNDADSITNEDDADDDNMSLKLVSAKDLFNDEMLVKYLGTTYFSNIICK